MIRILLLVCAVALAHGARPAHAVLRGDSPLSANDPVVAELATLKQRIEAGDAAATLPRLAVLLREYERAADVWNVYGFALRHVGRHAESRAAYDRALAIEPDHRGAHEYLGELLLTQGDRAGAERLLARLATLCPQGCEEHEDLARAIAAYRPPAQ
jgi:Flp pilus assembly protein TadD